LALSTKKTADCLRVKKTPPDGNGGVRLEREEMIRILEEIIRDPDTNATARCTAIRTLREIPEPPAFDESLYDDGDVLPMTGPARRAQQTADS
jgi:hypothetical protein